jgi:hypothetical protein
LPADYDHSGIVDDTDHSLWRHVYGTSYAAADGNGDGAVDAADFIVWRKYYEASGGGQASANVPEPAAATCIALVSVCLLSRRRRPLA